MAFCQCGCGQATPIATKTRAAFGHVKGQPLAFVHGHNARKPGAEYRTVMVAGKQLKIHRLRAERALGRPLPTAAVVHHMDGTRLDDAPLAICPDKRYHNLLHTRMRVKAAGGNPNTDAICTTCRQVKPLIEFSKSKGRRYGRDVRCKSCVLEAQRERRDRRRAA